MSEQINATEKFLARLDEIGTEYLQGVDELLEQERANSRIGLRIISEIARSPRPDENLLALEPYKVIVNDRSRSYPRETYKFMPGDFEADTESLVRGNTYKLRGFGTTEIVCCALSSAWLYKFEEEGALVFDSPYDLKKLDGSQYRYDGYSHSRCSVCQDSTPYHRFTKLNSEGEVEHDKYFIPLEFKMLEGMFALSEN